MGKALRDTAPVARSNDVTVTQIDSAESAFSVRSAVGSVPSDAVSRTDLTETYGRHQFE